ncbi:MAG: ATP-binding cassette domain-containing protein [Tannerellaceae bacterium]|nr:ATP-binding cassette domain-containing protein [Tannerellaceae bacterium]
MNLLETINLSFNYGKQQVLNSICLKIPQGSIYGYLGKNGAGKSTTIKLLLGLEKAQKNTIYFDNKEFNTNRQGILSTIGCLIETPSFYGELSAHENLRYLDILYKCGEKQIQYVLEIVRLTKDQDKKVKYFSTGMKQRLGIAMAMLCNPKLLILDEPFNGLDPEGVYEIRELMIKLQHEGKTIFLSSHILPEVEKICTHIGVLDDGELLFQGEIDSFFPHAQERNLESAFLNLIAKKL